MARKSRQLFSWLQIAFITALVDVSITQGPLGNCELSDFLLGMRNCETNFVLALCHSPEQDCWNHSNVTTVNACVKTLLRNCFEGTVPTESLDSVVDNVWDNIGYNVTEEYCTAEKFEGPFFPSNGGPPPCSPEYPDVLTSCETDFFQKYLANISDPTLCREFGAMTTCKLTAVEQHCNLTDDNLRLLNVTWDIAYNPFCLCPNIEPTTHAPTTPRQTATPLGRCSADDVIRMTQQCESEFIYSMCTNPDMDCITHPEMPTLENCTRDVFYDCIVGILPDAEVQAFTANFVDTLNAVDLYCNGTTFRPAEMRTSGEGVECTEQYPTESDMCVEGFMEYYLSNKSHPELCREFAKMTECKNSVLDDHCHSVHFDKLYETRMRLRSDYNPFCQCPNQYGVSTTTTTTTTKTTIPRLSTVTTPLPSMIGTAEMTTETRSIATTFVTTTRKATSIATTLSALTRGAKITSNTTTVTPDVTTKATHTTSTMTTMEGRSQVPTHPTTMATTAVKATASVTTSPQTTTAMVTTPSSGTILTTIGHSLRHTIPTTTSTTREVDTMKLGTTRGSDTSMLTAKEIGTTTHAKREIGTITPTTREVDTTTPTTRDKGTSMPTTRLMDTTTPTTMQMDTTTPTVREMETTAPTTTEMDTIHTTAEMDTTMPTPREVGTTTPTTRGTGTTTPTTTEMDTTTPTTIEMGTTTPTTRQIDTTMHATRGMDSTTSTTPDIDTTTPRKRDVDTTTPTTSRNRADATTHTTSDLNSKRTTTTQTGTMDSSTTTYRNNEPNRTTEPPELGKPQEQGPPVAVIAAAAGGVTVLGVAGISAYIIKLKFCKPSRVYIA